jgi:hypothetical protein
MPPRTTGRRLLTEDEQAVVRSMVADGATRDEIAAAIGVTPWVIENRLRDQLVGVKLKAGRPKGDEAWIEPTGEEEEASRSSLNLAPWVAARAAELRATWTPARWDRAEGARKPVETVTASDLDFTGDDIAT